MKLSDEEKEDIRQKDADSKRESRENETLQTRRERLEDMAEYKKRKAADKNSTNQVDKRLKKQIINAGIGLNKGMATSWIHKSRGEMSAEERKEYDCHKKRRSRFLESDAKRMI